MGVLSAQPAASALTSDDIVAILQSISGTTRVRKIVAANLHQWVNGLPASGALVLADNPLVYEAAVTAARLSSVQKVLNGIDLMTLEDVLDADYTEDNFLIHSTTAKRSQVQYLYEAQAEASPEESGWIQYGITVRAGPALESFGDRDGWATTGVANATAASNPSATQPFCVDYATSAVANNTTSHRNTAALGLWFQKNLWYSIYLNIPTITDVRFFSGMFTTGVNRNAADAANTQWSAQGITDLGGMGFRFDTSEGDTTWWWGTANGSGATPFTWVNTTASVVAGTMYLLEARMNDAGSWDVYVNKTRRLAAQANTAATNTHMRTTAGISTLSGNVRSWRLASYATAQKWF